MTEFNQSRLGEWIAAGNAEKTPVVLIHGDEYLVKEALHAVVAALLPRAAADLDYHTVEDGEGAAADALEKVNTYSLLSTAKVVALVDSRIFYAREDAGKLLEKARASVSTDDPAKAARPFLKALGLLRIGFDELSTDRAADALGLAGKGAADLSWVTRLVDHCRENGLRVPSGDDPSEVLERAVEKGFPAGHHLIVATDLVDRRRRLYKAMEAAGLVVDCGVPKGDRKADREAQASLMAEHLAPLLAQRQKEMAPGVRNLLVEMIGFDVRAVRNALEKVIAYCGARKRITEADVRAVVDRTRQDPIYTLTNALTERRCDTALVCLDSLLRDQIVPLQILGAIANQMRRVMLARTFIDGPGRTAWWTGLAYPAFQKNVLPAIKAFDQHLAETRAAWAETLGGDGGTGKKPKKKMADTGDLALGRSGSPYPVYLALKTAERFTIPELADIMVFLARSDRALKTSANEPRLILEDIVFHICGPVRGNRPGRP